MLPAAASIRKQGASRGATTSFLISTPESGLDSMAVTYALLDPLMTLARPLAAMISAVGTGLLEGLWPDGKAEKIKPDLSCPVDGCCDGKDCDPKLHAHHHTLGQKLAAGIRYALGELWTDLAGWFWLGLLLAGVMTALLPAGLLAGALGGGIGSMLIMLAAGVPLYICATASTPIAAALILKGASPGAALVFLMAGPATNLASLTMLTRPFGQKGHAALSGRHRGLLGGMRPGPGSGLRGVWHLGKGFGRPGQGGASLLAAPWRDHNPGRAFPKGAVAKTGPKRGRARGGEPPAGTCFAPWPGPRRKRPRPEGRLLRIRLRLPNGVRVTPRPQILARNPKHA